LVKQWVTEGFKINFAGQPPAQLSTPRNRAPALEHSELVDTSIEELLDTGAVQSVTSRPTLVSPLSVAQGKKLRLILGLSWLDEFVVKESMRFEDMTKAFDILKNAMWRNQGIDICLYLDDGVVCGRNKEEVESAISMITRDFEHAGIDLKERVVSISRERVFKAMRRLESSRSSRAPYVRERLRFLGTMNSVVCFRAKSQLYTRAMNARVTNADSFLDPHYPLNEDETLELDYWTERLSESSNDSVSGNPPEEAQFESSTYRELLAVKFALKSWRHKICDTNLKLRLDSQAAASILEKGSNNPALHWITPQILKLLGGTRTSLAIRWVPRTDNIEADLASRLIDFDDW
ncbi:hypothetical protein ANCDUO_20930, partial [Ancylostoma duodenale]